MTPASPLPGFVPASEFAAERGEGLRPGPDQHGVYLFRARGGEVVYVGKARSLRRRVLDHLHARIEKDGSILAASVAVDFVPTTSEREALLLEASLIKQYQPKFNTLLKDDRSYPQIAVTRGEEFPRILVVRRPRRNSSTVLFGPYTSAREARSAARILAEVFQIRRCVRLPKRACLYYHLKTCSAPCIGAVGPEEYRRQVDRAVEVLRGHGRGLVPEIETEMREASAHEEFERAAVLRDALAGLSALTERQHVVGPGEGRADVLAVQFPTDPFALRVAVGLVRLEDGEVVRAEPHLMAFPADDPPEAGEVIRMFLAQYYGHQAALPRRLYISGPRPPGIDETVDWLTGEKGVDVHFRPTGRAAAHARLAERLARAHVDAVVTGPPAREVLVALQNLLKLPTIPTRIEGVDISIFQGSQAVGSIVVFENGVPAKSEYRRFRIRGVEGTNDFAMIHEVVRRRYARQVGEQERLPDLLVVDGGRGQLGAAVDALAEAGAGDRIPAIGLAKREEEVYLPERAEPMKPNPNAPAMLLLRAVRDESHRFAVTYHRTRRRMALRAEAEPAVRGE